MGVALVLPAAGSGTRLGMGRPKALVDVGGVALVRRTLMRFASVPELEEVLIMAPPGAIDALRSALEGVVWERGAIRVGAGGASRQDSVRGALESLTSKPTIVCVHDAARPLVSPSTIHAVIDAAVVHGAATAASRPSDTVRYVDSGGRSEILDRDRVWLIETPQAFRSDLLIKAHSHAKASSVTATDDAGLVERCCGVPPTIVPSDGLNLKITGPDDLQLVRLLVDA